MQSEGEDSLRTGHSPTSHSNAQVWSALHPSGRDGYRGCPQINVAAEFSDPGHPARRIRARHKEAMFARLKALVSRMGVRSADDVAHQIAFLIDGAFTSDGRLCHVGATRILQSAVRALVGSDRMGGRRPRVRAGVAPERR